MKIFCNIVMIGKQSSFTILILFLSNLVYGQDFQKSIFDSLMGYSQHTRELRFTTEVSVVNDYRLLRIFQGSSKDWYIEEYVSNGEINEFVKYQELDELEDTIINDSIYLENTYLVDHRNLGKEFNKFWLELLTTRILDLPSLETIEYKLVKPELMEVNGRYELIEIVTLPPCDGEDYLIEVKDQDTFNRIAISNPQHYIKSYPNVDEFEYLNNFLKLIQKITYDSKMTR